MHARRVAASQRQSRQQRVQQLQAAARGQPSQPRRAPAPRMRSRRARAPAQEWDRCRSSGVCSPTHPSVLTEYKRPTNTTPVPNMPLLLRGARLAAAGDRNVQRHTRTPRYRGNTHLVRQVHDRPRVAGVDDAVQLHALRVRAGGGGQGHVGGGAAGGAVAGRRRCLEDLPSQGLAARGATPAAQRSASQHSGVPEHGMNAARGAPWAAG